MANDQHEPDVSRRTLLRASAVGIGTIGLAGCTGAGPTQEPDTRSTDADASQNANPPELDLETFAADTEFGTLQAERAANSYVGLIDDGQAIGIASRDDVGAGDDRELHGEIIVYLYDRKAFTMMIGEVDASGAATLESEEGSDFEATVEVLIEDDVVSGTVTFPGDSATPFTAEAATGVGGVYWAHGTDEEPDVSGKWVVLSDGRQWGCICTPSSFNPCCELQR